MIALFAQIQRDGYFWQRSYTTWNFGEIIIALIIICAIIGIAIVCVKAFEIPIPGWFWKILGIVALCAFAIIAIRFLMSL